MTFDLKKAIGRGPSAHDAKRNVSFAGSGKVSVSVSSIVNSATVQRHVQGVRELAASQAAPKKK